MTQEKNDVHGPTPKPTLGFESALGTGRRGSMRDRLPLYGSVSGVGENSSCT